MDEEEGLRFGVDSHLEAPAQTPEASDRTPAQFQLIHTLSWDDARIATLHGGALIHYLTEMAVTPVRTRELIAMGAAPAKEDLVCYAMFLRQELAIRMAWTALELSCMPHGLAARPNIRDLCGWCASAAFELARCAAPTTVDREKEFTEMLERMLQDQKPVVLKLATACMELKAEVGPTYWAKIHSDVDIVLSNFHTARLGVRFLMQQHVTVHDSPPGFRGMLQTALCIETVAKKAATDAMNLCMQHMGTAPEVEIDCQTDRLITHVPSHVHYILLELLKNAMRAVVDKQGASKLSFFSPTLYARKKSSELPAVTMVIGRGKEDVTFRVSDQGGGIPRSQLMPAFSFSHSTASAPKAITNNKKTSVLAGWGMGLPLARTYARYLGGELDVKSVDGVGTDAFLHLSIDGVEVLPKQNLENKM